MNRGPTLPRPSPTSRSYGAVERPPRLEAAPAESSGATTTRNRLLAVITALLIIAGLRWSYPVTMPLAAALFVIAVVWPVKPALDRWLPSGFGYVFALLILFAALGGFLGLFYFTLSRLVDTLSQQGEGVRSLLERYLEWAEARGLPTFDSEEGYTRLVGFAQTLLAEAYTVLAYLGIIIVLVILGLPSIPGFRKRLRRRLARRERHETFDALDEITTKFRDYVGITVLMSLLSGVAVGLFSWTVGLQLALVWGMLNFVMNFIPIVGNIIGIVPPTLYALVQFEGWTMPLVVFFGLAVILITISNFIYPAVQGRSMAMPAFVIIVALTFWGWLWGFVGVLLAIPLTAGLIIACDHFESTRRIARLFIEQR